MSDQKSDKNSEKKRSRSKSSDQQGKRGRDKSAASADKARIDLVGSANVPAMKIPKLQGPFPASSQSASASAASATGKKNITSYLPINLPISDSLGVPEYCSSELSDQTYFSHHHSQHFLDFCFPVTHGPTHSLSDEEPPELIPHPEEGEYTEEQNYYGVPTDDSALGDGTSTEFQFTGGFGRGRGATRRQPVLHPSNSVEYLGVGEFYDENYNSESVQIYSEEN